MPSPFIDMEATEADRSDQDSTGTREGSMDATDDALSEVGGKNGVNDSRDREGLDETEVL